MEVILLKDKTEQCKLFENIKDEFVQSIAKNMSLYGITPSVGRVYGSLYFAEEPMTLDDLREAVGMSKTSMSTGVRSLADMQMVQPVFRRGVRKDLYSTEPDWHKSFMTLFTQKWKKATETNVEEAEDTIEKLQQLLSNTTNHDLRTEIQQAVFKIEAAEEYYDWLLRFVDVMESGEIYNLVPKKKK